MRFGDNVNALIFANSIIYLAVFILNDKGIINAFSEAVTKEGFCVTNRDHPIFNSHRICFYLDTTFAILLYVIAKFSKPNLATAHIKSSVIGVFAHGVGHFMISLYFNDPAVITNQINLSDFSLPIQVKLFCGMLFFWYVLLGSVAVYIPRSHLIVQSVVHTYFLLYMIPLNLGFTYVQTVIVFNIALYEILKRPAFTKDIYYDIGAIIVGVPFSVVAWLEGILCISHAYYDLSIALGLLVYFLVIMVIDSGKDKEKEE